MIKRYISITSQIFPWYLYQIFVNRFKPSTPVVLPKRVGSYEFVEKLSTKVYPYSTGIYKDTKGKLVVAKVWQGKMKDIYYFNLIHQIKTLKVLTVAQKRIMPKNTKGFSIPMYLDSFKSTSEVTLIMEKIDGKSLGSTKSPKKQFEIFAKCIEFLKEINKKLTPTERKTISTKTVYDFILLYPLILMAAIVLHPKLVSVLLKSTFYFLIGIPDLLKRKADALVHGDLHLDNIIVVDKNNYRLIDTENLRLCYPEYEAISTISLKHNPKQLKDLVIKSYIRPQTQIDTDKKALRSLLVNNLVHYLSGDKNVLGIKSYLKTLDLAFSL